MSVAITSRVGISAVTPTTNVFGAMLRRIRIERQMSQEDLAAIAGLSASYVSRLEAGVRNPSRAKVLIIASALAVDSAPYLIAAGMLPEPVRHCIEDNLVTPGRVLRSLTGCIEEARP